MKRKTFVVRKRDAFTPPTGLLNLHDYTKLEIRRRNREIIPDLQRLGLIQNAPLHRVKLPPSLCQREVARERERFAHVCSRWLGRAFHRGRVVAFVTIVKPSWSVRAGNLTPHDFQKVKTYVQKRVPRLISHGDAVVFGMIDVSFNELPNGVVDPPALQAYWQVHAHILIEIETDDVEGLSRLLHKAFDPQDTSPWDRLTPVATPVLVKLLDNPDDLRRVREYVSSKLLANCNQRRVGYPGARGLQTANWPLRKSQSDELLTAYAAMKPRQRWILGGVRHDGDVFKRLYRRHRWKRDARPNR